MMKKVCLNLVCDILLLGSAVCQAMDVKVYSIADGTNDKYNWYRDGYSRTMWADDESAANSVHTRRAVLKFDTPFVGGSTIRGAVLNLWGGRSKDSYTNPSSGPATVRIYHYAYDGWGESSVPYARYLGPLLDTQVVDYTGYDRQLYQFAIGENMPYDNDGYLSPALTSSGNNAWFNTRNSVTWDGSKGHEPFIEFRACSSSASPQNGGFTDASALEYWDKTGPGYFQLVENPYQDDDMVAELTTGSPVTISQLLDTPEDPFPIAFDYSFLTDTGVLDVTLTDREGTKWVLGQLAADSAMDHMGSVSFNVTDPDLLFLDNVRLGLEWDGVTGSTILLDNITFADLVVDPPDPDPTPDPPPGHDVPEPATMLLLGVGVGCLGIIRRRTVAVVR